MEIKVFDDVSRTDATPAEFEKRGCRLLAPHQVSR